jgi:hypothetical protein
MLESIKWFESAATAFKDYLVFSEDLSKKKIDESVPFV